MKFLGGLGCALIMLGIIWGAFIPAFLLLAVFGLLLGLFACVFSDED